MADDVTFYDEIEAYCGRLSYKPGQVAELHVSTKHDHYNLSVSRWGSEQEVVWQAENQTARYTPPPPDADANGCGWPVSIEIPIDADWRSGFYLVTVDVDSRSDSRSDRRTENDSDQAEAATPDRSTAHACFVVTAQPGRANRALLVLATNTWNAYNIWGGKSLYTGGKHVSFRRPFGRGMLSRPEVDRDDRKARPARWGEEHDINGDLFQAYRFANGYPAAIGSSGWFTHERRFVEWAEGAGYQFDYCISSDLDDDPSILDGYDLFIDVGHDEYWSAGQRRTVESYVAKGGNFVSLSGNTMFWQVRLEAAEGAGTDEAASDDGATMVCHKYTAHETDPVVEAGSPLEMTGLWCDPLVGRPEWSLLGAGSAWGLYNRFGLATPRGSGAFTVYRNQHWMFDGTDLRYGDLLGADQGVVGYETVGCRLDFDDYQLPIARPDETMPTDIEIVAFTPSSNIGVGEYPASISALSDQGDLEFMASRLFGGVDEDSLARCRYGNAVMSICRPSGSDGGEVVVIGTTDWVFGLADDANVARVTTNVLARFLGD